MVATYFHSYMEEDKVTGTNRFEMKIAPELPILRAHPNYQRNGPWYDWVQVHWREEEGMGISTMVPAKILGFLKFTEDEKEVMKVLIHPCQYRTVADTKGDDAKIYIIFDTWTMDKSLFLINIDGIDRGTLAVLVMDRRREAQESIGIQGQTKDLAKAVFKSYTH
jgi:hypothetical protein